MGDWLKLQYEMRDLEQELEIRTKDNADLYAKLCNALTQLEEANEIIANFRTYDFTRNDELAEEYQVKYGIAGEKIYTNRKPPKEFERWRKKITKSLEKKLKSGV